jgi:23S rRNA (adenine2030-N6)-methyltransferase
LNAGIRALLKVELEIGAPPSAGAGERERLSAAGLLVVNPPFGFADEMRAIMPFLADALAQGPAAHGTVEILAEP